MAVYQVVKDNDADNVAFVGLMAMKGIQPGKSGSDDAADSNQNKNGKPPIKERIKEKLFTGSHGP